MTVQMSLKNCPRCNQLISPQAFACQHCGYALKGEKPLRNMSMRKLIIGIAIVLSCLLLMGWLGPMIYDMINHWLGTAIPCCS